MKNRKLLAFLLVFALAACSLTACGSEEYPGLKKLTETVTTLATKYNEVAQMAIDGGWEKDTGMLSTFNEIASLVETANEGIANPQTFAEGQIETLQAAAEEYIAVLDGDLLTKVSEPYNKGGDKDDEEEE